MTDNEIMNTVRRCADKACYRCTEYGKEYCRETIAALAWDMMYNLKAENERQKAEIERLGIELRAMRGAANSYKRDNERLRFAERLCEGRGSNDTVVITAKCLLKEMEE